MLCVHEFFLRGPSHSRLRLTSRKPKGLRRQNVRRTCVSTSVCQDPGMISNDNPSALRQDHETARPCGSRDSGSPEMAYEDAKLHDRELFGPEE